MTAVQLGGGDLVSIAYDRLGRRKSLARANGSVASYDYDGASRLTRLHDDLPGPGDREVLLAYNAASQIVWRRVDNGLYAWTGHGNGSTSSPVDGLNRVTALDGTALGYDRKGNLTFDGSRTYVYDSENRLSAASGPFHYDPLGRLAGASALGGTSLAIAYDQEASAPGLIAERWPASLAPLRRHVFGPGTDEPLVWYEGAAVDAPRFLHADERGSIVAVTDGSGAILSVNRFDEYGRTESSNPLYRPRFGYTGQRWFNGFGLYHYKARFYHPTLGRFMQTDPVGYEGGINLYVYANSDPVNDLDPSGTTPLAIPIALGIRCALHPGCRTAVATGARAVGETIRSAIPIIRLTPPLTKDDDDVDEPSAPSQSVEDRRRKSAPTDAPRGTRPIDKAGIDRQGVHDVKHGIEAAPDDYVGVDSEGNIFTTDPTTGKAVPQGNISDYDIIRRGNRDRTDPTSSRDRK